MAGSLVADDQIVVYPRRWKMALLTLGALVFVLLGLWIGGVFGEQDAPTGLVVIATYIGVPFFGLCFFYLLYRLVMPKPALIVNREGIYDNASAVGAGWLRWDNISGVRDTNFGGQNMIAIKLKDDDEVLRELNPIKRAVVRMNRGLTGSIVNIPQTALPVSTGEMVTQIREYKRSM